MFRALSGFLHAVAGRASSLGCRLRFLLLLRLRASALDPMQRPCKLCEWWQWFGASESRAKVLCWYKGVCCCEEGGERSREV